MDVPIAANSVRLLKRRSSSIVAGDLPIPYRSGILKRRGSDPARFTAVFRIVKVIPGGFSIRSLALRDSFSGGPVMGDSILAYAGDFLLW